MIRSLTIASAMGTFDTETLTRAFSEIAQVHIQNIEDYHVRL